MLSYRREITLQGALVLTEKSRLELTSYLVPFGAIAAYCSNFGHCVFEPPLGIGKMYDVHLGSLESVQWTSSY